MAEYQLVNLADFITLLDAQYASSSIGPGDNPARWAVVNAVIALATRFKTAPGSETDLAPITQGFYQNATMVVHQLILQEPSLLSIQALLAIAMFAQGISDTQALIMLATNASRQLELFNLRRSLVSLVEEEEQFNQVHAVVTAFDNMVRVLIQ